MILQGLDPAYVKVQLDKLTNLNTTLTDVRDTIAGGTSLNDINTTLGTLATEATTSSILTQVNKLNFDANNNLYVILNSTASVIVSNYPSWFTSSTKKTDDIYSGIASLDNALASVATDKLRASIVDALPAGTNWIGSVRIGNGTSSVDVVTGTLLGASAELLGVAPDWIEMLAGGTNYEDTTISVSTTQSSSTFSPPLKFALITNTSDTDVLIRINGSSAVQKTISAHTYRFLMFPISSLYYVVSSGSGTIRVEGVW